MSRIKRIITNEKLIVFGAHENGISLKMIDIIRSNSSLLFFFLSQDFFSRQGMRNMVDEFILLENYSIHTLGNDVNFFFIHPKKFKLSIEFQALT